MLAVEDSGLLFDQPSDEIVEEVEEIELRDDRGVEDLGLGGAAYQPPPQVEDLPPPPRGNLQTPAGRKLLEQEIRANWEELRAANEAAEV